MKQRLQDVYSGKEIVKVDLEGVGAAFIHRTEHVTGAKVHHKLKSGSFTVETERDNYSFTTLSASPIRPRSSEL